jgi:hypothetical protein
MDRRELETRTLSELRELAKGRGLSGISNLRREQLIDRLVAENAAKTPVAVPARSAKPAAPKASPPSSPPQVAETETLARLYEQQGHFDSALEIYRRLRTQFPERADLSTKIDELEAHRAAPAAAPPRAPAPSGPAEPIGMLDYEELPETYGVDDVMVIAKDPHTLFVYWEITPHGRAGARSRLGDEGHSSRLVLRVYTVDAGASGGSASQEQRDEDLDWDHGRRYLATQRSGVRVSVAVGLRAPSGGFAPIAHSRAVLVPPAEPGPDGPVEWMEVVPNRRRGGDFEPIVIVTQGKERLVRGAPAHWEAGAWLHPGSSVPRPPIPQGGSQMGGQGSFWLRLPSSSQDRPRGGNS